jgi:hypothetical protein
MAGVVLALLLTLLLSQRSHLQRLELVPMWLGLPHQYLHLYRQPQTH